jgi:putative heme-binding domain-containing protein
MIARQLAFVLLIICSALAFGEEVDDATRAKDARRVKALMRLENPTLSDDVKASVLRYLETKRGTEEYLNIVDKFRLAEAKQELLRLAVDDSEGTLGVSAAKLLLKLGQREAIDTALAGKEEAALKLLTALRLAGDHAANEVVLPLIQDPKTPLPLRNAAVRVLGSNRPGQEALLKIVEAGELANDLKFAAANALLAPAVEESIRSAAGKHLSLPATADSKPLPPLADLVKQTGNAAAGKKVFETVGTCIKCHKVKGEGKDVGPDLSEIGSKLSKEAFFVSILDPSAGISHNYETYVARLDDGTAVTGVLVSDTDEELILKTAEAIVKKLPKAEVEQYKKTTVSLMPADLQKALTAQNLVDVVEYLTTLKKAMP